LSPSDRQAIRSPLRRDLGLRYVACNYEACISVVYEFVAD